MQKIQYEYEKANHIQKVSNLDILLLLNTTKVVYPPRGRKSSGPSFGRKFSIAEISVERKFRNLNQKM